MPPVIIYLTGFRQNAGKTTAALGIISSLRKVLDPRRIGYLKPVGQEVIALPDGSRIDKDAMIVGTFSRIPDIDLHLISPVRLASGFTKRYLESGDREEETRGLKKEIQRSLARLAGKDVIVAEGTGHPGVGSIVGLSNAKVSNLMKAQIVFLSGGGIGKALDQLEVDLSYFFFKRSRVRGVIFNKLLPEKIPTIRRYITEELLNQQFDAVGGNIRIFGYLPVIEGLDRPSMQLIHRQWEAGWSPDGEGEPARSWHPAAERADGRAPPGQPAGRSAGPPPKERGLFASNAAWGLRIAVPPRPGTIRVEAIGDPESGCWKVPCRNIKVVSNPAENLRRPDFFKPGDIIIMSSSFQKRSPGILRFNRKLKESSRGLGGLILTGGAYHPLDPQVRRDIERAGLPAIQVPEHTAICEEKLLEIYESTKLQVYDEGKVEQIEQLYAEHFDLDRFLETFHLRP